MNELFKLHEIFGSLKIYINTPDRFNIPNQSLYIPKKIIFHKSLGKTFQKINASHLYVLQITEHLAFFVVKIF